MGNVTVPTPVLVAGGALCLLAGYLVGLVAGPDTPDRTTATVASYDRGSEKLCLTGEAAKQQDGANDDGELCGRWRRSGNTQVPQKGDRFRFVTIETKDSDKLPANLIYGNVVG